MNTALASLAQTLSPAAAADREWDALVMGAGPAGALAARQIALHGGRVLLVDKASFPRYKVCGACLNGAALATLAQVGLGDLPGRLGAAPLTRWRLHTRGAHAECPLPAGVSLSREAFDAALVEEAIHAGADFLPDTRALVEDRDARAGRLVALMHGSQTNFATARIVLVADGLSGGALANLPAFEPRVLLKSRVGAGVILDEPGEVFSPGCIYMACGKGGYVGLVRLEDGRLDVAAAFDHGALRGSGGPGPLGTRILREVNLAVPAGLEEAPWRGTAPLARSRKEAAERLFVLGDAAGYLEPFTGEGIAWALASAAHVAPLAVLAAKEWQPRWAGEWRRTRRQTVARKQRVCRLAGAILRRPLLAGLVSRMLAFGPWLAGPLIREINRPAWCVDRAAAASHQE